MRNLRSETTKLSEKMNFIIDFKIEEDFLYQRGEREGLEKGLEKGREEQAVTAIYNMRHKGFDVSAIAEVLEVSTEFVQEIFEQIKKEPKIQAGLKAGKSKPSTIAKRLKVSPFLVEVIKKDIEE